MGNLFCFLVVVFLTVPFITSHFKLELSRQRRVYWACACAAALAAFFWVYPKWKDGIGLALLFVGALIVVAYCNTPYIKIGGKVYALTVQDTCPENDDNSPPAENDQDYDPAPDAYSGLITASKTWWLMLPLLVISSINVYHFIVGPGEGWVAAIGIAMLLLLAVGAGYGDASWGYNIARGQYIQFGIAAVITAGAFAVVYLIAYYAGKHWPLRRKQSMEYRAHPRHRRSG